MSKFTDFLQKSKTYSDLRSKILKVTTSQQLIDIAKQGGFTISESDLEQSKSKLSDKELETAAGGAGGANCIQILNTEVCNITQMKLICR